MAAEFLPLTFVAKQDSHDHVKELFQNTWNENVGGSRAVLLYLREILQLATQHLDSPRWAIKHASALAVTGVVTFSGNDISLVSAEIIWPALEKALGSKTWDGKERVLKAFVEFISKARTFWKSRPEIDAKMRVRSLSGVVSARRRWPLSSRIRQLEWYMLIILIQVLIFREARRNSPSYRQHALLSLRDSVGAFDEVDMFGDVCNLVGPLIRDLSKENDEMDIDSAAGKETSNTM